MKQKVLITGASVGIGRHTAIRFAKAGAWVVVNYNKAEDDARETLRLVEEAGGKGWILQADIADENAADKLVKEAAGLMGGLDVLVNNAGITRFIPFSDLDAVTGEVWDILYRTNVESVFFCSRAAAKIMKAQKDGGSIINLASAAGMLPIGSSIPYCVSKAAIIHLTKCLAREFAPLIRVNAVSPGVIQNTRWNSTNPAFNLENYQAGAKNIPLQKLGNPDDVAEGIFFLASNEAGYITGTNLPVEGGVNVRV